MVGSSLRNAVSRRNHKERGQLAHRSKLGHLEKHKDYVKRARDYHSKQDRIKVLREKAAMRNKDEFYFGMISSKTQKGMHVQDRGNTPLPTDLVRVLKTQDSGYINMQRAIGLNKIERIKNALAALVPLGSLASADAREDLGISDAQEAALREVGLIPPERKGKGKQKAGHVVFKETEEEVRKYRPSSSRLTLNGPAGEDAGEEEEDVDLGWKDDGKKKRRRKSATAESPDEEEVTAARVAATEKTLTKLLTELSARLKRSADLTRASRELELTRALMGKGAKKKLVGGRKGTAIEDGEQEGREGKVRVFKWRAERRK